MPNPPHLLPASDDTLLEVVGPDALKFLQGQTSADFAKAQPMDIRPGAFCDIKGRVLSDFLAFVVDPERVLLRVSADLAETLQTHLKKYLMFAKAELVISDLRPAGTIDQKFLETLGLDHLTENLAPASSDVAAGHGLYAATGQTITGGYAIPIAHQAAELFLNQDQIPQEAPTTERDLWQYVNIALGLARVRSSTSGQYLPQDLNYDLTGFINFKKGCYTGQEIIARLHWRGTPKRRLYLAGCAAPPPPPGTPLFIGNGERKLGSVINATPWPVDSSDQWLLNDSKVKVSNLAGCHALMLVETTEDGLEQGLSYDGGVTTLVVLSP